MTPNLTDAGKNLLLRALTGETINFTRIVLGNGPAQDIKKATGLINPLISTGISKIAIGSDYVTLTILFTNGSVTNGFHITEMGIFATDPDDESKEILYALGNEDESTADPVPSNTNRMLEMQFDALVFIGDAQNVTAAINSSLVYASKADFDSHTANQTNPHGVTKAQVGLGNVPNVSTNNQTPTYSIAGTLAEPVSGENLSTVLGKLKRAVNSLISHIANRNNPHGVTAAQVNAAAKSHTHNATDINAGALPTIRGGTGIYNPPTGKIPVYNGLQAMQTVGGTGALFHRENFAFPEFGTLPISAGGTGTTSLDDFVLALSPYGLPKIVTGSYIGTGNYGSSNKNQLTFASTPKLLFVQPAVISDAHYGGFVVLSGTTATRTGGITNDVDNAYSALTFDWTTSGVTWYSTNSANYQLNANGSSYNYIAIL